MELNIITLLLGSLVGVILGLTGAGGSIIAVPLLVLGLHLSSSQAAPIALLAVALSATAGASMGLKIGQVRYRAAALIAMSGIIVAPLGIWCASKIPNAPMTLLFCGVLAYVSIQMLRQIYAKHAIHSEQELILDALPCKIKNSRISWNARCAQRLAYSGALTGFLSGLLGVGGGFVVVPALKKYSNIDMQQILPSSLSVIALISCAGILTSMWLGHMPWSIAAPFAGGALLGMLLARRVARHLSSQYLQSLFAIFALLVACTLLVKTFNT
jgi:uncharacterized protein